MECKNGKRKCPDCGGSGRKLSRGDGWIGDIAGVVHSALMNAKMARLTVLSVEEVVK